MGYRTEFNLFVYLSAQEEPLNEQHFNPTEEVLKIVEELRESSEDAHYALEEDGQTASHASWSEHEQELAEFSKKYPTILFELAGIGDETTDIWSKYFKNGRMQYCEAVISFPPFDESKLQEVTDKYF